MKRAKDTNQDYKKIDEAKSKRVLKRSTDFAQELTDKKKITNDSVNDFRDSIYSKILKRHNIKGDLVSENKATISKKLSPREDELAYESYNKNTQKNFSKKNTKKRIFKSIETFLKDSKTNEDGWLKDDEINNKISTRKSLYQSDRLTKVISNETNKLKSKIKSDMKTFRKTLEFKLKQYKNS